jgi:hypothetical protein
LEGLIEEVEINLDVDETDAVFVLILELSDDLHTTKNGLLAGMASAIGTWF